MNSFPRVALSICAFAFVGGTTSLATAAAAVADDIPLRLSVQTGYGLARDTSGDSPNYFGSYIGLGADWSWAVGDSRRLAFGAGVDGVKSIGETGSQVSMLTFGPSASWRGDRFLWRLTAQAGVGWSNKSICPSDSGCIVLNWTQPTLAAALDVLVRATKNVALGLTVRPAAALRTTHDSPAISGSFFGFVAAYTWCREPPSSAKP